MTDPNRIAALRAKMLEHLEAAQACSDETRDGVAAYLIERALDEVRSLHVGPYREPTGWRPSGRNTKT
jgi:hypothetical protein